MDLSIYVASLSDYNNGILHGKWIKLAGKDAEDVQEEIKAMLADSPTAKKYGHPAEEWAIHDSEGFPSNEPGETSDLAHVMALADFLFAADESHGLHAANAWIDNGMDPDFRAFEDAYCGTYESLGDWAEELESGISEVPERFRYYIDWEAMGRDAELNGDIWSREVGYKEVVVFWSR